MSRSNTPDEPGQHWTPASEDDVEGHRVVELNEDAENTDGGDDVEGHRAAFISSDDPMTRKARDDEDGAPGVRSF